MSKILSFLVVDDDALVRHALNKVLTKIYPEVRITEADCLSDGILKLNEGKWSLIILDLSLGQENGMNLIRHARALKLEVPILVLSAQHESDYALSVLKAGANGFLCKDDAISSDLLASAIRNIFEDGKYVGDKIASQVGEGQRLLTMRQKKYFQFKNQRYCFLSVVEKP